MTKFIFLGPPGAGKGTQAALLAQEMNLAHISTGEILRSAVQEQTPLGIEAQSFMSRGELVPDRLVLGLVKECLEHLNGSYQGWILDGFPRNIAQADALDHLLGDMQEQSNCAVNLDVPDEILIPRLLGRGRQDDTEEVVRNRLQVYRDQTAPLIDFYQNRQHLVSVNGDAEVQEVTQRLKSAVLTTVQASL
ncbi:MAG: adenylate kinase [Prochlorotrichaceae cyanobacterium]